MLKHLKLGETHFLLWFPLAAAVAFLLLYFAWPLYPVETHLVMELLCIVVSGTIFVLIWFSYDKVPDSFRPFGFAYLIIAILYTVHIALYSGYTSGDDDLSLDLVMSGRIIEALAFFTITLNLPFRMKRPTALAFSLTIGSLLIYAILALHEFMPVLYDASGYTATKIGLEFVILLTLLINMYLLRNRLHTKDIIAYSLIFSALVLGLLLTTFFILQKAPNTTQSILGHLLRVAFYFHLFKGTFVSAVTYPYEKLEEVLNHLPLAVTTYDREQRLTIANNRAEEITGLKFTEVKGLSQQQIVEKMFGPQTTSYIQNELSLYNEVQQKILTLQNQEKELVKVVTDVYKLQSGGYLCVFDTANNVQEIQNLRLQTQTILNSLSNLVVIIDVNEKVIMCNQAFYDSVEMGPEQIIGMKAKELAEIFTFSRYMSLHAADSSFLESPQEISIVTPSGKTKDWLLQLGTIKNVDGEIIGGIGVGSDITSLKKEQSQYQQQEKLVLLGQMATGIVHEIRNPITAMMGFLQILNMKLQDENLRQYCHYIEKEALDLNRIVTDFLQFARPLPAKFKPIAINEIIDSLRLMIDTNLFTQGIKVHYDLPPNLPLINADENKIKQVILNILKNAIDALKGIENPKVSIRAGYKPDSQEAFVSIANNGALISPEVIQKMGTPFFTTKTKGTGLGLSICNNIITEHKGRIKIASDRVSGTTFEISFPVPEEADIGHAI